MENETLKAEPTRGGAADMPGVRPEDVTLRYEKGELTLVGHVKPPEAFGTERLHEYEVGDYVRTFTVHESIDSEKISAEMKNGVLTVRLGKRDEAKPRQIKIQAA